MRLESLRYKGGNANGDVNTRKFRTAHAYVKGISPNFFKEVRRRREKVRFHVLWKRKIFYTQLVPVLVIFVLNFQEFYLKMISSHTHKVFSQNLLFYSMF